MQITVVAADDHPIFLEGLKGLFAQSPAHVLVASVGDGDGFLEALAQHKPDIALMDISMPGPGPEAIIEAIEAGALARHIVALTMHQDRTLAQSLFDLGLDAYVLKDAAYDDLLTAIGAVMAGDSFLSAALLDSAEAEPRNLTDRELTCLQLAAKGLTSKMIGREIGVTERTVRFHFSNICRKFSVQRRSEAVFSAIKDGVIEL